MIKKAVIAVILVLCGFGADAQKRTVITDIIKVYNEFWLGGRKITAIETDSTFSSASHNKIPTVKAVKDYVAANGAGISALTGDVSASGSGSVVASIGANKVTSVMIRDTTINTQDIKDAAITAAKLNSMSAISGQVLKWNGSVWAPGTDNNTGVTDLTITGTSSPLTINSSTGTDITATAGTGISLAGSTGNFTITNTGDTNSADDITTSTSAGGSLTGTYPSPTIAGSAVASPQIRDTTINTQDIKDAAITAAKLNSMSATSGQVLKWNGSQWAPSADNGLLGSGADNQISYWASGAIAGNSNFTWDGNKLGISGQLKFSSPSDGRWLLQNNASTDFEREQFGGNNSSFPAFQFSSAQTVTLTFTNGVADIVTTANTFKAGDIVRLTQSGQGLPVGFLTNFDYFVLSTGLSSTNIQLSLTPFGTAITTGTFTAGGTYTAIRQVAANVRLADNSAATYLTAGRTYAREYVHVENGTTNRSVRLQHDGLYGSRTLDGGYAGSVIFGTGADVTVNSRNNITLSINGSNSARFNDGTFSSQEGVLQLGGSNNNGIVGSIQNSGNLNSIVLNVRPLINNTGTYSGIFRGIFYNPVTTSLTGTDHRAIETLVGDVRFGSTSGNVGIGVPTGTAIASKFEIRTDAVGTSQTNATGISLTNTTPGTSTQLQMSPALRWRGQGWETTGLSSQPIDFRAYVYPVSGSTTQGVLTFESTVNNGGYGSSLTIGTNGNVGIGTGGNTMPTNKLQVSGTAQATKWYNNFSGTTTTDYGVQIARINGAFDAPVTSGLGIQFTNRNTGGLWADDAIINRVIANSGSLVTSGFEFVTHNGGSTGTTVVGMSIIGDKVGVGVTPTARLSVAAGTTSTAPLNIPAGTNTTSIAAGNIENNGTDLQYSPDAFSRYVLIKGYSGTSPSLDFPAMAQGTGAVLTFSDSNAASGDIISIANPFASGGSFTFSAGCSTSGTIWVNVISWGSGTNDPGAATFKYRILK